jgi:hypothetical protein
MVLEIESRERHKIKRKSLTSSGIQTPDTSACTNLYIASHITDFKNYINTFESWKFESQLPTFPRIVMPPFQGEEAHKKKSPRKITFTSHIS